MDVLKYLWTTLAANRTSAIITIFFGLLSVHFYIKGKRIKRLAYSVKSFSLVKDFISEFSKLQVCYDNNPIQNLTITILAIWNHGTEIIEAHDLPKADPLRIEAAPNYTILDVTLLTKPSPANQIAIKNSTIFFDYLEKNEGAIFRVLHTGTSGSLKVFGTVKGAAYIRYYRRVATLNEPSRKEWIAILFIASLVYSFIFYKLFKRQDLIGIVLSIVCGIASTLMSNLAATSIIRVTGKVLPPSVEDFATMDLP